MSPPTDREAIIDAFLRSLQAIDDNDASLMETALTPDTVLDMSGLSIVTGTPMTILTGLQMATAGLLEHGVGPIDTGHVASNFRLEMKEDVAYLSAMTVAAHYRKGEGSTAGKLGLTVGNRWKLEVVDAEDGVWKIRKAELKVLWCEGDLSVLGAREGHDG